MNKSQVQNTLNKILAENAVSCVWKTVSFSATKKEFSAEKTFVKYGETDQYVFSVMVSMSFFTAAIPVAQDLITIEGIQYRIMKVNKDTLGTALIIDVKGIHG